MRLQGVEIAGKEKDGLYIELEDEYLYMDYYRRRKSDYNYIKRKYESSYMKYGSYISVYREEGGEALGYFYLACCLSVKPIYKHPSYTRYAELLEFGFLCNDLNEIRFLLDYMIEYAQARGSYFIRVRTRERSFEKFYTLLREYPHTEDERYIYLTFPPMDYAFARHLVHYKGDRVTLKELYHLQAMGFRIEKERCVYELYDKDRFVVDRKTRRVSYPDRIINRDARYERLGQAALNLMHLVIFDDYDYQGKTIDVGYRLDGYDYELIKIGRELLTFERFKYKEGYTEREDFADFAIKAYGGYGFTVLRICTDAKFTAKTFYADFSKEWNYLPSYAGEGG